jgi:metal-dependent hydrolase (beta-lactamase superfamily II)
MQAAVIDPGGEVDRLIAEMQRLGVTPTALWLTHAHIDHAGGTGEMARRLDLPIVGPHRAICSGSSNCPSRAACSASRRPSPSCPPAGWRMAMP